MKALWKQLGFIPGEFTDLKDNIFLDLINFSSQAAVGDGIDDDWLVGFWAWLLEEFRTCKQRVFDLNIKSVTVAEKLVPKYWLMTGLRLLLDLSAYILTCDQQIGNLKTHNF